MKKRPPAGKEIGRRSAGGPGRLLELERENAELRRQLAFRDNNISLLNVINSNMRAALSVSETYYVILTAVTADTGLRFNRAMLFMKEPLAGERKGEQKGEPKDGASAPGAPSADGAGHRLQGVLAIGPDNRRRMKKFYEEAKEKRFDFSFYVERLYSQNLRVDNRLNERTRALSMPAEGSHILARALALREPILAHKPLARDLAALPGLRGILKGEYAVAPVGTTGEPLGVLVVDNHFTRSPVTGDDLAALKTLGEFAASLIVAAQRYEESEQLAVIDELTQLYNFRFFERRLAEETARARRYNRTYSVLMLDIDHFKHFNDTNGHLTGNKALIDLSALLRESIRSVDLAARYGGEEFAVILPETGKDGALRTAAKILQQVRAHSFVGGDRQPGGRVTASAGVATWPEDGESPADLMERADTFLYRAKANGKDQHQG